MWLVGQLRTGGDARGIKGFTINSTQYAFLADGQNGLQIINIVDAGNPVITANYNTSGFVKEVIIDSISRIKYAFLSDTVKGLYIINVSDPSAPILIKFISYQGGIKSSCLKNGFLYTALMQNAVKVLNVNSLPDSVYEVCTYTSKNPVEHIEISGSTAFFTERIIKLEIVDISKPSSPVFLSTFNTSGSCVDIKIADNLAYIADGNSGVAVVNTGNPSQPYLVSQTNTKTTVLGIDYSPNFLFTAEHRDGAEVFNLFNPTLPEAFGYYEPGGYSYSVNYFKGKVLIANGQNGLLILRF